MSNNRTDEQDKEEEEEEEEEEEHEHEHEEEEELFYESLDRALSTPQSLCSPSSSISCSDSDSDSASDDDDDDDENCGQSNNTVPKFPDSSSFSTYEVWTTQPSSVEERRKRLLRDMGLIADASLSRSKPSVDESLDFVARSVSSSSSDHNPTESCSPVISRSISDTNAADCESSSFHRQCNHSCCRSSSCYRCLVNNNNNDDDNSNRIIVSKSRSNGSPIANFASSTTTTTTSPNKPPTGKPSPSQSSRRMTAEEIRSDSLSPNPNPSLNSLPTALANADEEKVVGDDAADCCDGMVGNSDQVCTIKNLDNGEEFLVNEFGEDGMWDKVREVGTGRQLTMEEFETCVGHSPIVQELMRRQNVEQLHSRKESKDGGELDLTGGDGSNGDGTKPKKKGGWFKSIKNVANTVTGYRDRRSSDERDTSSERGGRRSSSATDDSQDVSFHGPERVRVRQYGKSCKELTGMYKTQEIQAHNGSIWSVKFSLDGQYLASAGEDCIIHIWRVLESDRKEFSFMDKRDDGNLNMYFTANGSPEPTLLSSNGEQPPERKRRGRTSISRKSISLDNIVVPESVFALSEKPIHSFYGHQDVVLDLSWSKSQLLLSSSMDKTVRLWDMATDSCLKVFSHSDYVTCIQFNPVDDRYFISGSLDAKVRIWSIPDRQVIDWYDLHEMVTATCYTPDGKGALVGSYKGSCCLFNTSENKLHQKHQINLQNKKKKSHLKKITGFQFAPGSSSEVLITSADSRIRVIDGVDLVHKFKGFCNTSSQISASLTANGKYAICASGDSHVYIWNNEGHSQPSRSKVVTITSSYEYFHCQDVSVAIPWPGFGDIDAMQDTYSRENSGLGSQHEELSAVSHSPLMDEGSNGHAGSPSVYGCINSPLHGTLSSTTSSYFFDRISATWPEENLFLANRNQSPRSSVDFSNGLKQSSSAWGTVIVTAGLRGEIKTFQNFGLPYRL